MLLAGASVLFIGGTLVRGALGFIAHWTPAFAVFYIAMAVPVGAWVKSGRSVLADRVAPVIPAAILAFLALVAFCQR